jgi:mono/diheme cytochrome c family protein
MELFMKSNTYVIGLILVLSTINIYAQDWSKEATLPGNKKCIDSHGHTVCFKDGNRKNIYQLEEDKLYDYVSQGARHVQDYPVTITPLQIPFSSLELFFENEQGSALRRFVNSLAQGVTQYKSLKDMYQRIGLHEYPKTLNENGPNLIPNMGNLQDQAMGATIIGKNKGRGMTFSCAACHSANLFGKKVVGLTNRFPGANEFFHKGQKIISKAPTALYQAFFKATKEEVKIFKRSKEAVKSVGIKVPIVKGLDTSLAQVGLSLAKRNQDEYATFSKKFQRRPRKNGFDKKPADSKPAVWWNVKYKTKWLSDGSIISGNPIHTNFLWNEIGRGVDLKELETWLIDNKNKVDELTAYVFNTEAPKYNEFFPKRININTAIKGQKLFLKTCSGCHGIYEKGWENSDESSYIKQLATTKVWYHEKTPTIDIGTDEHRYQGMGYMDKALNSLKISKSIKTVVKAKKGYVPPPLIGVWARFPYFHNNSAPTLWEVITPDFLRVKAYKAIESLDPKTDFDFVKNGYPSMDRIKEPFKSNKEYFYDTRKVGMSNKGHTRMLLDENGNEKFTRAEKLQIIEFLKTL